MKQVKVRKSELREILFANRKEHREIFLKAQAVFRDVAIGLLDKQLAAARKGDPFVLAEVTSLQQPRDYTEHYDRALRMLDMSVDDVVILTEEEFRNFVEDKWNWSRSWALSNSAYTSNAKISQALEDE